MFSLFAVLGLGAYHAGKGIQKTAREIAQEEKVKEQTHKESVLTEFADNFFMLHNAMSSDEALQEAGKERVRELNDELEKIIGAKPSVQMILWAYMAKNGRVPKKSELYGFDSPFVNEARRMRVLNRAWSQYSNKEIEAVQLKYLKWYDSELRKRGMVYELLCIEPVRCDEYVGRYYYSYGSFRIPIHNCDSLHSKHNHFPRAVAWYPTMRCIPDMWI